MTKKVSKFSKDRGEERERERETSAVLIERETHWRERGSLYLFGLIVNIYKNLMENVPITQFDGIT